MPWGESCPVWIHSRPSRKSIFRREVVKPRHMKLGCWATTVAGNRNWRENRQNLLGLMILTSSISKCVASPETRLVATEAFGLAAAGCLPPELFLGRDADLICSKEVFHSLQKNRSLEELYLVVEDTRRRTLVLHPRVRSAASSQLSVEINHDEGRRHRLPLQRRFPFTDAVQRSMQLPDGICVLDETDRILHAAHHLYLHSFHRPPGLRVLVDFHVAFLGFRGTGRRCSHVRCPPAYSVCCLALMFSHQISVPTSRQRLQRAKPVKPL